MFNFEPLWRRCKKEEETTKEEIDGEVKDEDDGSDSNNENELGDQEDDTDVRDVRYKLESFGWFWMTSKA